ncbi:MAG: leucyl/phenylalanyl-tRNA--protein transferase [Thiotrichales bacterium]|nr:leucyl/phenylalanyl-tRNA--protein transferase [Thiotrichales bacterium]
MTLNRDQARHSQLYWVSENIIASDFPRLESALRDPDGLLAIGGDLSMARLLDAYQRGIFPWYNEGQPIMWWSPDPRCVLEFKDLRISRSLRKSLRNKKYRITLNHDFYQVIRRCSEPRRDSADTWITEELIQAFLRLHESGYAHSIECWSGDDLVGGLYGMTMGKIFFGESMFSRQPDASKIALVHLCRFLEQRDFRLIDCQVYSPHLRSLGAKPIPRKLFANLLGHYCKKESRTDWDQLELEYDA